MSLDPVVAAINDDFVAALDAFDSHSFTLMNVMANRIMSNVLFGETTHRQYLLPGFLLKKYYSQTRLLRSVPAERKEYKQENTAFTKLVFDYIFQHLLTDIDSICRVDGGIVRSSVVETERVIRVHGCEIQDLSLHSLLVSFSQTFNYRYFESMSPKGDFDSAGIKAQIQPTLAAIQEFYQEARSGASNPFDAGTELLETLVLEWRKLFLKYHEIGRQPVQERRSRIELPQAAKEQITESLKRAIQQDVFEEPRRVPVKELKEKKD